MSTQSLEAFRKKLAEDEGLRKEMAKTLTASGTKDTVSVREMVAFANSRGYDFTFDEARAKIELSEQELENVAGGAIGDRSIKMNDMYVKLDSFSLNFAKIEFNY